MSEIYYFHFQSKILMNHKAIYNMSRRNKVNWSIRPMILSSCRFSIIQGTFDFNFPTTTIAPNCSCLCNYHNYTDAELQAWIEQLKSELLLNKRALSSSARKKISASDPRASSQAIGSIGALVIVTIVGIIVFPDIPLILKQVKHLTKR